MLFLVGNLYTFVFAYDDIPIHTVHNLSVYTEFRGDLLF